MVVEWKKHRSPLQTRTCACTHSRMNVHACMVCTYGRTDLPSYLQRHCIAHHTSLRTCSAYLRKCLPINVQDIQNPLGFSFYLQSSLCDIPVPALDWAVVLQKTLCPRAVAPVSPPDKLRDVMSVQVGQKHEEYSIFC